MFYKERIKKCHDAKILKREFLMRDEVLLFNKILKFFVSKLKSKWSGIFMVVNVYSSGVIKLEEHEKRRSTVNG